MNDHAHVVLAVWQAVSDFVPMAARDDAAEALMRSYMEAEDIDVDTFYDLSGDCQHLDAALEVLTDKNADEDADEDEGY